MELTPPVAYRMSLTAAEVEELLLSIYTKIPTDTIRTSLDNPDDLTIPTTKAVADAIAVINADLEQLGALALLDSVDLGSSRATGILPIAKGGTGANTVEQAQLNLGIVVASTIQEMIDASIPEIQSVDLGSPQATGVLPLSKGGTGATTASQARANLGVWSSSQSLMMQTDIFEALRRSYAEAGYTLVPGSFEQGGTVSSLTEVLLFESEGGAYNWTGTFPKIVGPSNTPASSGGVGVGAWQLKSNALLKGSLAANGGAATIGASSGNNVQQELDAIFASLGDINDKFGVNVNVADYPNLKAAIAALPVFGGVVIIPEGRFYAGDWTYNTDYMAKENVFLKGTKAPTFSSNADRLMGSVIYGRFNAFAHNFSVEDVGFDFGKYVVDTFYPGKDTHAADHPLGGTWDAFAFAQPNLVSPLAARQGFRARNVIGLLRDSLSVGHAMLFEAIDGGNSFIDNATGMYGVHSLVLKSRNIKIGTIAGYAASVNCVIIKSDAYARGGDLIINEIDARKNLPGITPWSAPADPTHGLLLNAATADMDGNIQIGSIKALGVGNGVRVNGDPAFNVSDVQIGQLISNGFGGSMGHALICDSGRCSRFQVGIMNASNGVNGISWNPGQSGARNTDLIIDQAFFLTLSGQAIRSVGNAVVEIAVADLRSCATAYYVDDTARLLIGTERLNGVTTKWGRAAPTLNGGWVDFGSGNSTFDISLKNYGVVLSGLIKAQATLSSDIINLPAYLKPSTTKRYPAYFNNGTRGMALIGVDATASKVILNDGTAPAVGNYVSLDSISWSL